MVMREIPDHATLRGKGANTAWLDKLAFSPLWPYVIRPALATCNFQSIVFCTKCEYAKKCSDCPLYFKNIFEN